MLCAYGCDRHYQTCWKEQMVFGFEAGCLDWSGGALSGVMLHVQLISLRPEPSVSSLRRDSSLHEYGSSGIPGFQPLETRPHPHEPAGQAVNPAQQLSQFAVKGVRPQRTGFVVEIDHGPLQFPHL